MYHGEAHVVEQIAWHNLRLHYFCSKHSYWKVHDTRRPIAARSSDGLRQQEMGNPTHCQKPFSMRNPTHSQIPPTHGLTDAGPTWSKSHPQLEPRVSVLQMSEGGNLQCPGVV